MSEQGEYSNLESDGCPDFSKFDNRFQSFRGSTLARQVPPERLARAGFYFTGDADRVQCFSCNQTVENWHSGDTPVQRHKEVSPSCRFLVCSHPNSMKPNYITPLIYDEVAEDMQYRVSTGEVVDETLYPRIPHMKSEQVRLDTFSSWPSTAPVRPRDLAQAGFYYLGQADRVECFCCGNKLNNWENGDRPWEEHATHFPNCFFILGHDVGNVPLLDNSDEPMWEDQNVNQGRNMETFEGRLSSFAHVRHPVDHERLARAGFYSTGQEDQVLCFCCGGGLKGWQPDEDPWEEHAKEYPGCSFLLEEKGAAFVNSIQLKGIEQRSAASSHQNGFSASEKDEDPMEKLMKLQREKQCKICMDRDICIVFIPCGHLVSCKQCSESLVKCPICCGAIAQKIKAYIG
ncbi:PREDICTED: E3 ubiquitin-protein ligase XIAP-like [Poecilia mexicana]|uniref:E3 ubiquitin-protein ligase XIAP n=1 Tax=Poecilia mexicana TaxID=48701 RepID=A0A3B3WVN8_9TELE|nr:PREDICTED: E3 ubiquitin-protein ligase XIAP-like [Poecilia mexicana]XP_014825257.1 PREDICTED: E3 ubiquitin-protein ligase XIAP-like [Poecilia mexicana]